MITATAPPQEAAAPVAAAVLPDHLSWSGIKTYATCPKKFYYRYIAQVPQEFVPAALAFGGSFHRAVEIIQQARIEGSTIPALETLLAAYDAAWKEETHQAPEIQFAKTDDAVSLHEMAGRMLSAYREHVVSGNDHSATAQIIGIEHENRFRLLADVPPIEMRLDLLELDGPDLIVTDVKTSRSRWNEEKARENLSQLILYAHGLMPLLRELGAKRIVPRFLVVTKAKTPVIQVLEPKASQEDVERLKRMVSETWEAIQKEVYVQREGWQCVQCPFKKRCLG